MKTPNSITLEAFCANLVAAFLPVVVEERDAGIRILSVMDGFGERQHRDVERAIDELQDDTAAVAEALGWYLASMDWQFDEDQYRATDWVATALCDAGIARAARDGWAGATNADSVTATLCRYRAECPA